MGKWGNGKQTADISLLQSSKKSQCPSMYALTERSSLPDSWQQRGMQRHCITVCKLILCIFFTSGSLLAISWNLLNLWIVHTLFQLYTKSYWSFFMHLLALLWSMYTFKLMHQQKFTKCTLQSFFSGFTHWLCREYNYCVFACTEWRREFTTALYMSETILSDKVDICTGSSSIAMLLLVMIFLSAFSLEALYRPTSSS